MVFYYIYIYIGEVHFYYIYIETDFEDDETTKDRFIHQMELRFQIADSDASGSLSKEEFKIVVFPEQYIPDHLVEVYKPPYYYRNTNIIYICNKHIMHMYVYTSVFV